GGVAPDEATDGLDRASDRWTVDRDLDEIVRFGDRLVHGQGQPGQRDVRGTTLEEELAIGCVDLGDQVGVMNPSRVPTLGPEPNPPELPHHSLSNGVFRA